MRAEAGWSSGTGSGGGCEAKSVIVVRGEGGCGWNGAYTYECKWVSESSDAEMLKLGCTEIHEVRDRSRVQAIMMQRWAKRWLKRAGIKCQKIKLRSELETGKRSGSLAA